MIITASCGIEPGKIVEYKPLVDGAIDLSSHKISSVILYQRLQCQAEMIEGRDFDWDAENVKAGSADIVPVKSEDPAYIPYASGTTGGYSFYRRAYCGAEMVDGKYL